MAFVLAAIGAIGTAGVAYLSGEAIDTINSNIVQPIANKIELENKDSEERTAETLRQKHIANLKTQNEKYNDLRRTYKLKERRCFKLHNNTANECRVIYINHYLAKNENDAKNFGKKVIDVDYFSGDYLNRSNVRIENLGSGSELEIIADEWKEYYLVLMYLNQYYVIGQNMTNVKDIVFGKRQDDSVDIECRWY